MKLEIREPQTELEFKQYYQLRWEILRKPWNQPKGSEKDDKEADSIHLAVFFDDKLVGCGRGHFNTSNQAQIRYMAVDESFRQHGIGTRILKELEKRLIKKGAKEIILKAREKAVPLYKRQGYEVFDEGEIMFGEIMHYWMRKKIESKQ